MIARMIFPAMFGAISLMAAPLAAAPCFRPDSGLAGKYQLNRVMETGSVIILADDGRFGYMLSVGAFDEIANGCWRRNGNSVILTPTRIRVNSGKPTFKTLNLKLDADGGLIRVHKGKRLGIYVRSKK